MISDKHNHNWSSFTQKITKVSSLRNDGAYTPSQFIKIKSHLNYTYVKKDQADETHFAKLNTNLLSAPVFTMHRLST